MKTWRDSASLIVAAGLGRNVPRTSQADKSHVGPLEGCRGGYDYDLLCLKRHQNSSFMPGSYVFPGGEVNSADASLKWTTRFSSLGLVSEHFNKLLRAEDSSRPNILRRITDELPREVSLRITAIRETFEETGILLCARGVPTSGWARNMKLSQDDTKEWQERVHRDAAEFYSLCEKMECYPDLWSLYEWNNWLTPTFFKKRRFDTMFYLACFPEMPRVLPEESEVEELIWGDPKSFFDKAGLITLPPPQQYEIARLARYENIQDLLDHAMAQSKRGVRVNMAVKIALKDGNLLVFPGDDLYPENVSLVEHLVIDRSDRTIQDVRDSSRVKHRLEVHNGDTVVNRLVVDNYECRDGHSVPLEWSFVNKVVKNKL